MKIDKNFHLEELVSRDVFDQYGINATRFLCRKTVMTLKDLRIIFGKPFIINNWKDGGPFNNRGFRTSDCTEGAKESSHKRGMAIDFHIDGIHANEIRAEILKDERKFMDIGLTTLEIPKGNIGKMTWVHFSVEWIYNMQNIYKIEVAF